ncbi:putative sugar kinase YdjE [Spirochaetia bacterium]|nr:putative sugar kinase YdjE [Spirochaetia bacterium]GHU68967.1 putative sugar kinase YdjE [Spirochaetia bacterium]
MYDVFALGELLVDFTPSGFSDQGIALFARNPGGVPANVLTMNAKLGAHTAFIGKVGNDDFGHFLEKSLQCALINTTGLLKDPIYLTTLAFVHLSENGDHSFSFYRYARAKGKIISYDPNYRVFLRPDANTAKNEISSLIPNADILKVSEEEMLLLAGETDIEKGVALLAKKGTSIVLVSLGPRGSYFLCGSGSGTVPAYDVKTIDTTGAGDSFLDAVHYRLRDKSLDALKSSSRNKLIDIIDFANAAGSLTTTKKGTIPALPTPATIKECRRGNKKLLYRT